MFYDIGFDHIYDIFCDVGSVVAYALQETRYQKKRDGKTILLIEHDVSLVMGICDSLTVLDYGKTIAVGSPREVRNNPEVIRAYLGNG